MRKAKTWRSHHDHKDFQMTMCDDFSQRKVSEMFRYLAKFKTQESERSVRKRIENQMNNLKKKMLEL